MGGGNPMQRQSTLDKAVAAGQIPKWRKWFHISFDPFKVPKVRAAEAGSSPPAAVRGADGPRRRPSSTPTPSGRSTFPW